MQGRTLRAVFEPTPAAAAGITVSDVKVDGVAIKFGGQIAQKITLKLTGVASTGTTIDNAPVSCGPIPQSTGGGGVGLLGASPQLPPRRGDQ